MNRFFVLMMVFTLLLSVAACGDGQDCVTQSYRACYPDDGEGSDVYWFDSCGHPETMVEDCLDAGGACQIENDIPYCGCVNHWRGSDCDECLWPYDTLRDCADCVAGLGNIVFRESFDLLGESYSHSVTTFDEDGNPVVYELYRDDDESPYIAFRYTYDEEGRKVTSKEEWNIDGTLVEYCHTYQYDTSGRQILDEKDNGCDGTIDRCTTHKYDTSGRPILIEHDDGCDGVVDDRTTYEYSRNEKREERDSNMDGTADEIIVYKYDEFGNEIELIADLDGDRQVDVHKKYDYTYDEHGNMTEERIDNQADGVWDTCVSYSYDGNGNRISKETDYDCDGIVEEVSKYFYDGNGHEVREENDGYVTYWHYCGICAASLVCSE